MKTNKIIYWVATILFAGMMLFSAIPNITGEAEATQFITQLGYPKYFIPFIGVAKLLGSVAILVPGLGRSIKEWAYAGLFFDLGGALFSLLQVHGWDNGMFFMLLIIAVGGVSYAWYHKLRTA